MMLKSVAQLVVQDATGATNVNPDDRFARLESAGEMLVEYAREGFPGLSEEMTRGIAFTIAHAMIVQYEYDQKETDGLIDALMNPERELPSEPPVT
jgi:hypothetical protein